MRAPSSGGGARCSARASTSSSQASVVFRAQLGPPIGQSAISSSRTAWPSHGHLRRSAVRVADHWSIKLLASSGGLVRSAAGGGRRFTPFRRRNMRSVGSMPSSATRSCAFRRPKPCGVMYFARVAATLGSLTPASSQARTVLPSPKPHRCQAVASTRPMRLADHDGSSGFGRNPGISCASDWAASSLPGASLTACPRTRFWSLPSVMHRGAEVVAVSQERHRLRTLPPEVVPSDESVRSEGSGHRSLRR